MTDYAGKEVTEFLEAANRDLGSGKYKASQVMQDYAKAVIIGKQLQATNKVLVEDLAIMTGNYQTHAQINADLEATNKRLREVLKANIYYCEYFDGEKHCGAIARWGVFDYDGWEEYYCDEHKGEKTCRNELEKLKKNILAEQALKE